jgi:malate/lactate dehydrogenase
MSVVAIFGAGELGGALASKLAARARVLEIRLIDSATGVAAGKALDILQAAPIEQSATRLTTSADDAMAAEASVIVLADQIGAPPGTPPVEIQGEAGLALLRRVRAHNARAPIVCAGASPAWLIAHAAAELSIPRTHIIGSAPYALVSALRALVALELNGSAQDVNLTLAGTPPHEVIVPWHAASASGATLESLLDHATLRRLDAKVRYLWPPGPYALASAASRFVEALITGSPRTFCGFVAMGLGTAAGGITSDARDSISDTAGRSNSLASASGASGPSGGRHGDRAGGGASAGANAVALALPLRLDPRTGASPLDMPALTTMQRAALTAALDTALPR